MTAASISQHLARADELRHLERYDLALQEVQRALALEPESSAPHICAAWIMRAQKRLPDAEQAARSALTANPNDDKAHHILAIVLWEQRRHAEARQSFEAALALVGGHSALYLTNYARMMTNYHTYSDALSALALADRALAIAPTFADPHEIRGLALRQLGRHAEAEEAFRTALRCNPQSFSAQHNLGLHDLTLGRADAALARFREALRLNPNSTIARTNLVLALKARNPLYGRLLSLTLRTQRPAGRRRMRWLARGGAVLFALVIVLGAIRPELGVILSPFIGGVVITLMLAGVLRIIWQISADPIFNTLLRFDPLGRDVVPFHPSDAAVTGSIAALTLALFGLLIALPLLGDNHPASNALMFLAGGGIITTLFAAALRALSGWGRWLAWSGYALVAASLLCIVTAQLLDIADISGSTSAPVLAIAGDLFVFGLMLFGIGYVCARPRQRTAAKRQ